MAKKRRKRRNRKLRIIASTAVQVAPLLLIFGLGSKYAYDYFMQEYKAQDEYDKLANELVVEQPTSVDFYTEENQNIDVVVDPIIEEDEEEIIEEEPEFISTSLLDSGYEFNMVDFETLKQINPDAVAWIDGPGCIDYPVVIGEDNDYYLHHDIEGKDSGSGTIFQDCRIERLDSDEISDVTILYGHHMRNGSMFAGMCKYTNQSYLEENPFLVLYTPDGYAYEAQVFATRVISGDSDETLFEDGFADEEEFNNYINFIKSQSVIDSNVSLEYGDKLLATVTCSYGSTNERTVVYMKLVKQYTNYNQITSTENYSMGGI